MGVIGCWISVSQLRHLLKHAELAWALSQTDRVHIPPLRLIDSE